MRIWNSSFLYKPLLSPLQAPYKHLPSNKSLRKNKTKQNKNKNNYKNKKARKNKTVVVVVKKIWNSTAKTKPSLLYVY
ncbi:hypothetical protein C3496_22275 [Bacillus anthracis]|uniref:hypothetical protein n=1 Tax=Bacillus TaxID=1386 RepID=UPI0010A5FEC4|nr:MULTISPECIES: hypothetical protein [Bacillus]QBJ68896.1 hypothetical protein C3496_22275 [Bacillus anthracis]THG57480.1 hypothetical protein E7Y01_20165 [Bacillus sp. HUB-I-004]